MALNFLDRMTRIGLAGLFAWALVLVIGSESIAAQDDERLDSIFERLHQADAGPQAKDLERQIWQIWSERNDRVSIDLLTYGSLAMSNRNFNDALKYFSDLVEHDPQFAEAWNKRATLYYLMGDYDNSVIDIQRTLTLEPRHFGALSGLGLIFMATGNPEAAISSFEKALEINPHMPGPRHHIEGLKRQLEDAEI